MKTKFEQCVSNSSKHIFFLIEINAIKCRIRSCGILFNGFRSEENPNFAHTNYTQWMYVAVKATEPTETRSSQMRTNQYNSFKLDVYSSIKKECAQNDSLQRFEGDQMLFT